MSDHTLAVVAPGTPTDVVGEWAAALGVPVEIDEVIDPVGDLDPRRRWPSPAGAAAVLQIDGHDAMTIDRVTAGREESLLGVIFVQRRELLREGFRAETTGARHGLSQLSFVAPRAGITAAAFVERYQRHMDVVREEHPGVAHYRQDVIVRSLGVAPSLSVSAAVSQLWFPTADDFGRRYYASSSSADIVRADVSTFLDYPRTWSVLTHEHHLAPRATDH